MKHKPATALPWDLRGGRGHCLPIFIEAPRAKDMAYALDVCGDDYTGYGGEAARERNFVYMHHAATQYPLLVEALQYANAVIFAAGAPLGSERYFKIRDILSGALKQAGESTPAKV